MQGKRLYEGKAKVLFEGPEDGTLVQYFKDDATAFFKQTLGDKVKDVRVSKRLTTSAVCLVADDGDMDLHLARLMRQHKEISQTVPRILELNPKHALIANLAAQAKSGSGAEALEDAAYLLLDQARILDGEAPLDPSGFAQRLAKTMARGLV